jgi:hypothetical protein
VKSRVTSHKSLLKLPSGPRRVTDRAVRVTPETVAQDHDQVDLHDFPVPSVRYGPGPDSCSESDWHGLSCHCLGPLRFVTRTDSESYRHGDGLRVGLIGPGTRKSGPPPPVTVTVRVGLRLIGVPDAGSRIGVPDAGSRPRHSGPPAPPGPAGGSSVNFQVFFNQVKTCVLARAVNL